MLHTPAIPRDYLGRVCDFHSGPCRLVAFYERQVPGLGLVRFALWARIGDDVNR